MSFPQIVAGMAVTSALLQSMLPLTAVKSADTARSLTTTLTADPALTVTVVPNATYQMYVSLLYKGNTTNAGDLKFGFTQLTGASLAGGFLGITNPLGLYIVPVTATSTLVSYSNGTSNPLWCQVSATLVTTSGGGTFALLWAQNTSNATATTLMAGSSMSLRRTS